MKVIGVAAVLAVLAAFYLVWSDPANVELREHNVSIQKQEDSSRIARERNRDTVLEPAAMVGQIVVGVVLIVALSGLVAMVGHYYWQRRKPMIKPDERGLYPVSREQIEHGALLALTEQVAVLNQQVRAIAAQHQPGQTPSHLTFSPSAHYEVETSKHAALPALDAVAAPAPTVPSFAQLLDTGRVGKGQPLLLGVDLDDGAELPGSWLDLYSTIVAGLPGAGKTTSQRFFACQTALHGAGFVVVDPHFGAAEDSLGATLDPLRAAYLCEPVSDPARILEAVKLVDDIGRRRVQGDPDRRAIVLWVDETTALLNNRTIGTPLAELLEEIARQYRKVGIYASCSGQIWSADRSGGSSALRDSFASVLCHRIKRGQARMLLPLDDAQRVERLEKGQAVLWRTSGASNLLQIPLTTADDARRVAGLLTDDAMTMGRLTPEAKQPAAQSKRSHKTATDQPSPDDDYSAAECKETPTAEAMRIVGLFLDGKDASAIVGEVYGLSSKAGKPYMQRLAEVQAVIRQALQRQQGVRDAA